MCHHKAPHRPWQPDAKHANMYEGETDSGAVQPATTITSTARKAAANATLKVGENMNKTRSEARHPARSQRRRAAQVGLSVLHQGLPALRRVGGRQRRPGAGLPRQRRAGEEHDRDLHLRPGLFPGRSRLFRQALHVRGVAAHAVPGALSRRDQAGVGQHATWCSTWTSPQTFLDFAGAQASGRHAGPQLPSAPRRARRRRTGAQSMYYRYWMHLADHGVPAHYGVRTKQYKLIYYYGKALGSSGAIDKDTPPEWELFDCRRIRTR